MTNSAFRFPIRVKAGTKREAVGGTWAGPDGDVLVVAVMAPAVNGKANDAVARALAGAMGVPNRDVTVVGGVRSRNKVIKVDPAPDDAASLLIGLRSARPS